MKLSVGRGWRAKNKEGRREEEGVEGKKKELKDRERRGKREVMERKLGKALEKKR